MLGNDKKYGKESRFGNIPNQPYIADEAVRKGRLEKHGIEESGKYRRRSKETKTRYYP